MRWECETIERCLNWRSSLLHQGDLVLVLVCLTACPPLCLLSRLPPPTLQQCVPNILLCSKFLSKFCAVSVRKL